MTVTHDDTQFLREAIALAYANAEQGGRHSGPWWSSRAW